MGGLLDGRACVVTGGARGIGAAIAERFAQEGARVLVCDVLDADGTALRDRLRSAGGSVEYVTTDVCDPASVVAAADAAVEVLGGVDVLVANAGVLLQARVVDTTLEQWRRTLDVNLTGVLRCCQAFGRLIVDGGRGGRILVTASIAGRRGGAFYGAYAASKHAVVGLAQCLAAELAPAGVHVACVCPGAVDTGMMEAVAREQAAATGRSRDDLVAENVAPIALGRYAEPAEIADVFVALASPLAGYVTGESLVVDGGMPA